ncbi:MAG: M48 family metalloprotease [Burkholderiaceae bacterium]|nr:M48 family metalloprotease [Burkholderiaceae bacterium]
MNHRDVAGLAGLPERLRRGRLARRDLLWLIGASSGAAALASLSGCATSPVTGETILVGMSEAQERSIDAQVAPHQFSQDLGEAQDAQSNTYVSRIGADLAGRSHRPDMPYSYRVLNANYVNAYTFPGGAMGVTRGIMTEMKSEAELAALLGHELGHVNARHAAQRQGQAMLAQAAVVGLGVATSDSQWSGLIGLASQVGASALLSSYSRDNEREADALGQEYMARAGYPASGMTSLHELLLAEQKAQPSMLQTMFSTHPMPAERVATARQLAATRHAQTAGLPVQRERFMDSTARLRALRPTIQACQKGEAEGARERYDAAEGHFRTALKTAPRDYAANVLMAKCLVAQKRPADAKRYAEIASAIDPKEAQAIKLAGIARLGLRDYAGAFAQFDAFDKRLPGDPGVTFLKGVSLEGGGQRREAAAHYARYANSVRQGDASQYAVSRLKSWGYVK